MAGSWSIGLLFDDTDDVCAAIGSYAFVGLFCFMWLKQSSKQSIQDRSREDHSVVVYLF